MRTFRIHDQRDVEQMMKELLASYLRQRPTDVLRGTIKDLETLHSNYFDAETGPGGHAWAPNSAATVARKGHGDVLQDTLKMRNAMTKGSASGARRLVFDEGHHAGLVFGLDDDEIPYWKYHDVQGGSLPWRPFIGMTSKELDVVAERLLDNQLQGMVEDA